MILFTGQQEGHLMYKDDLLQYSPNILPWKLSLDSRSPLK